MKIVLKNKKEEIKIIKSGVYTLLFADTDVHDTDLTILVAESDLNVKIQYLYFNDSQTKVVLNVLIKIPVGSKNSSVSLKMNGLVANEGSRIEFCPAFELNNNSSNISHSTSVGHIYDEWSSYFFSRGLSQDEMIALLKDQSDL